MRKAMKAVIGTVAIVGFESVVGGALVVGTVVVSIYGFNKLESYMQRKYGKSVFDLGTPDEKVQERQPVGV